jgi:formylglycine-generating enzyme required for sulfatase activity
LLLEKGTLTPTERYVPAGFFIFGSGNKKINSPLPKDIWVDGFISMLFPITQHQILEFFNDLVDSGKENLTNEIVPRHYTVLEKYEAPFIYKRDSNGRFYIGNEDINGDASIILKDDHPAIGITVGCSEAYAAWLNKRQNLSTENGWRLPTNQQWEKMARGVDGRLYTWGNRYTPQWAHTNASVASKPTIDKIDGYPVDESPYGVRSLSGCIREWTSTRRIKDNCHDVRGSSWFDPPRCADVTGRNFFEESRTFANIGFRLVRPVPKSATPD